MGPTWVLSAPDGPRVGPINLVIRDSIYYNDLLNQQSTQFQNVCRSWLLLSFRNIITCKTSVNHSIDFMMADIVTMRKPVELHFRIYTLHWRHNECDGVSNHVCSGADQRKTQRSASWGKSTDDRWIPSQSASNGEMFQFDDVIMTCMYDLIPGSVNNYI